jgi:hypothetical protein
MTYNNADYSGMKWEDSLTFFQANLEKHLNGQPILGVIDKKSGTIILRFHNGYREIHIQVSQRAIK